jgi:hypothetical protein
MKTFLKSADLQLVNGGYLVNKENTPVSHAGFVEAQKHADYIVTFAKMAKGKDFAGKKADSLEDLVSSVKSAMEKKTIKFVDAPKEHKGELTEKLAKEAMGFMTFKKDSSKADKINAFMQQFEVLHELEEFGLFFEEDIVKLQNIYTVSEILTAVESVIDLLS